jgi:transposase-like protein
VSERALVAVIQEAWIGGVSTRRVDELVQAMGLAGIGKSTVSKLCKEIDERVGGFLDRPAGGRVALPVARRDLPEGARGRPDRVGGRHNRGRGGHRGPARDRRPGPRPERGRDVLVGFLKGLVRRGLKGVKLVVSDAHEGLKHAIAKVLGAAWQRCRVHWMRNALAHVPKGQQTMVAAALRQAFLQADQARRRQVWRQVADQLRPRWPKLATLMDESEHDVLAYMAFPAQHRTKLHSTNPLERLNKEVKRRADVVGIFPNEPSIVRLIGAVLLEANDEWQLRHRYMQVEVMAELLAPGPETDTPRLPPLAA